MNDPLKLNLTQFTIGYQSFFQLLSKLLHSPVTNRKGKCDGIIQFIVISINGAEQSFSSHINKLGLSYIFLCKSKQNLIASFCHYCNIKTAVTQYKNISKYCTQKILLSLVTPHIWKSLPCAWIDIQHYWFVIDLHTQTHVCTFLYKLSFANIIGIQTCFGLPLNFNVKRTAKKHLIIWSFVFALCHMNSIET